MPHKKIYAVKKRQEKDSYLLEVICRYCKRRGKLWFLPKYKLSRHCCPTCGQKKLDTPIWLNKRPMDSATPTH